MKRCSFAYAFLRGLTVALFWGGEFCCFGMGFFQQLRFRRIIFTFDYSTALLMKQVFPDSHMGFQYLHTKYFKFLNMVMLNYQHLNTDVYNHTWLLIVIYLYQSELWKFTLSADTRWRKSRLCTSIIILAL